MVSKHFGIDAPESSYEAKLASGKLTFLCVMDSYLNKYDFQGTEILEVYLFLSKHHLRKFLRRLSRTTTMTYFNTRRHQLLHLRPFSPRPFTHLV